MLTPTRGIHGQFVIKMDVIMCGFLCARNGSGFTNEKNQQKKRNRANHWSDQNGIIFCY